MPSSRFATTVLLGGCLPALMVLGGCDTVFEVENPIDVTAEELEGNADFLNALLSVPAAAAAEYYDNALDVSEVIADDMMQPGTNVDWLRPDRGEMDLTNEAIENLYNNLSEARWHAEWATTSIRELVSNPDAHPGVGRGYYWDALLQVTLADLFEQVTFNGGSPRTPVDVYQQALGLLQQAAQIASSSNQTTYEAAAYATMARVHRSLFFELDDPDHLRQAADFAQEALSTQSDFRLEALYQPPGSSNGMSGWSGNFGSLTNRGVGPAFVGRTDPVSGALDPRVQTTEKAGDGVHGPYYFHWKYPARESPIPVSRWQEARLIIAEHRLQTGDVAGAVQQINLVRAAAGLPSFQSGDAAAVRAQLIYERRTEFWLELRNWQDHRYYEVFPERWTPASRENGIHRRLPISNREQDGNPNV